MYYAVIVNILINHLIKVLQMDFDVIFDCNGKVNINDWQLSRGGLLRHNEVDNVLFPQTDYPFAHTEVKLFDCVMPGAVAVMNLGHFTNCME